MKSASLPNPRLDTSALRDLVINPTSAHEMVICFAKRAAAEAIAEIADLCPKVKCLLEYVYTSFSGKNIAICNEFAESEIEKMILSCLVLSFLKSGMPLRIIFHAPDGDALAMISEMRSHYNFRERIRSNLSGPDEDGFDRAVATEYENLGIPGTACAQMIGRDRVYDIFGLSKSFHLIPQAKIVSHGKKTGSFRVDLLAFVPSVPDTVLAMEFDGFEFHSSKERFTSDRQRDRALRSLGVHTVRFSGTEIFSDPVKASFALMDSLFDSFPQLKPEESMTV